MKTLVTLFISAGILMANFQSHAQIIPGALSYHEEALMFSNYSYTGSARMQGIGNAQISLGGDISLALSNPAGLGFYNRSELTITPSYNLLESNSQYLNTSTNASKGSFNIDNLGVVFNKTKDDFVPGKWRGGSFAISYSKVNEFNSKILYEGLNSNNDIIDYYVTDANEQDVDPGYLNGVKYGAYQTYLIGEFVDVYSDGSQTPYYDRTFFAEFPTADFPTNQSEEILSSGSQNQWSFSYGGNYGDFLYLGATLGVQSLRYQITKTYSEEYAGGTDDFVNYSILVEDLLTDGIGVNGSFGVIARPIQQMTLGVSLITPTYLSLSEKYYTSTEADFNNFDMNDYGDYFIGNFDDFFFSADPNAEYTTPREESTDVLNNLFYEEEFIFDYSVTTPLRLNAGLTYFFNKNGFISGDIEYVDYSTMKVKGKNDPLEGDNANIKDFYQSTLNYRIGTEWRIKKLRLRGGYNLKADPYSSEFIDLKTQTVSGGLGFRSEKFSVDLAASYQQYETQYAPYIISNPNNIDIYEPNFVTIKNNNLNFILSFSLFF